jgi:RNA polymerase sigma-70 factor (ECF subfamily)
MSEDVLQTLDRLAPHHREILSAHYWDGLSGAECAALFDCTPGAVWVRLHRARAAFRSAYGGPAPHSSKE